MELEKEVILSGRRINDGMGKYVAEYDVDSLIFDPYADAEEVRHEYGLEILPSLEKLPAVDAVGRARCILRRSA